MATTYSLIASNTLSSSAASVTFSAIPNTFTDLVLKFSVRNSNTGGQIGTMTYRINGNTSGVYAQTFIRGDGSSANSNRSSATEPGTIGYTNSDITTSNTFSNGEIYIPNYTNSSNKPHSVALAHETNSSTAYITAGANLFADTSAITSLTFQFVSSHNFLSGSSFFLYGIKNS